MKGRAQRRPVALCAIKCGDSRACIRSSNTRIAVRSTVAWPFWNATCRTPCNSSLQPMHLAAGRINVAVVALCIVRVQCPELPQRGLARLGVATCHVRATTKNGRQPFEPTRYGWIPIGDSTAPILATQWSTADPHSSAASPSSRAVVTVPVDARLPTSSPMLSYASVRPRDIVISFSRLEISPVTSISNVPHSDEWLTVRPAYRQRPRRPYRSLPDHEVSHSVSHHMLSCAV